MQVGSGSRLRHADGTDQFAARHARQKAVFLLFGTVIDEVMGANAVHALTETAQAASRQFLVKHHLVAEVTPDAAVVG